MRAGRAASIAGLGSDMRRRRLELGLSQSRLAEMLGVPPTQIGRWERGDQEPDEAQVQALAGALELHDHEAAVWLDDSDVLAVEILSDPVREPEASGVGDPWGLSRGRGSGSDGPGRVASASAATDPPPVVDPGSRTSRARTERALRRQARLDERRIKRELTTARRAARERVIREARLRREMEAAALRSGALPMLEPGYAPAPPAGAANTGSVFPVPDTRHSSERVTYRSRTPVSPEKEKYRYSRRAILTVAILVTLVGLLVWALVALGDGLGAVLDLFRGGGEPESGLEALRMVGFGRGG